MERVFTSVYENCTWGDNNHQEYKGSSGGGSEVDYNRYSYVPVVKQFITENNVETIVDLGCGDFKCGRLLYDDLNVEYTGYDAYKKVTDLHSKNFFQPKYTFIHSDFYTNRERIKKADLCIIKDVVQHWSLGAIYTFLDYLVETKPFKYVIITNCAHQEHDNTDVPDGGWRPLSSKMMPLKKYNLETLYKYDTKEVCLLLF